MNALEIIASDKKYLVYCKRVCGGRDVYKDLHQYMFEVIAGKDKDYIKGLFDRDEFGKYYAVIAYRSYHSPTSPFYKEYRKEIIAQEELVFTPKLKDLHIRKELDAYSLEGESQWFEVELFKLYLKEKNYRAINAKTRIPLMTICNSIQSLKKEIKKRCEKYY